MAMPGCSGARLCAALLFVSVNVGLLGLYATRPVTHYTISGRVADPHKLRSREARLTLGRQHGDSSFGQESVPIAADGSFIVHSLEPGIYLLEVLQTSPSGAKPEGPVPVAFEVVRITNRDVRNVMLTIRRDTAITGHFKMESSNPAAAWPTHIVVHAQVALDGAGFMGSRLADGAPGGTFVLRNAFGPRVIRAGYSSAPGSHWWPSRVMLDGRDITNVPTDFSAHENGPLEMVFTQHPTRLTGIVRNPQGEVVSAPWIVVTSADRALWQWWATTSLAVQGNTKGAFSMPLLPGDYLVRAVPQTTFDSWQAAHAQAQKYASEGVRVTINAWGTSKVALTLQP